MARIQRALLSVSDKTGIVDFARRLHAMGIEIISTGGTAAALRQAGIPARDVSEFTGSPEILNGRVKTLHPKVHGGLLFRRDDPEHQKAVREHGIGPIDLVAVNLYPFRETARRTGATLEEALEQIDIGGPSILRSAAKNHPWVTVVCRPASYPEVLAELEKLGGSTSLELRARLAREVFRHTAEYDQAIAAYLEGTQTAQTMEPKAAAALPGRLEVSLPLTLPLRYGENPHQAGGFYGDLGACFEKLHGKELSYNNILDLTAAQELIEEFPQEERAAAAIIKHNNPCGAALGRNLHEAWEKALATDRDAAGGGIVALNRPLDLETAEAIDRLFTEIVAAPDFDDAALELLKARKKNRILIRARVRLADQPGLRARSAPGGFLVQQADRGEPGPASWKTVTRRQPTRRELEALGFAWKVVKHLRSNAIAFTGEDRSLGLGAGQMSRIDSARVAVLKAGNAGLSLQGSVVASDAFFPFADGLLICAGAGATAAIQPGGSIRDEEVIRAADDRGLAMVFTGVRHFLH
ncbi:MAG: bifunctional phosphoribosylaminoimidazolecarboxamide formyltransferase/IMP cyclohydrolase [Planctomycetes bacterium]|nr:bifunctional phosphoribosylaminoimidazolecarboxamide formyltransferase/IMP cyclohydrolase [Planctomycetota bacterium]